MVSLICGITAKSRGYRCDKSSRISQAPYELTGVWSWYLVHCAVYHRYTAKIHTHCCNKPSKLWTDWGKIGIPFGYAIFTQRGNLSGQIRPDAPQWRWSIGVADRPRPIGHWNRLVIPRPWRNRSTGWPTPDNKWGITRFHPIRTVVGLLKRISFVSQSGIFLSCTS